MERQVKKLIYFALYWIIYNSLISRYIWSNEVIAFIPDIIIFYLFFTNIKKLWKFRLTPIIGKVIPIIVKMIFVIGIIGALLSMNNIVATLWGIRMELRYILLFMLTLRFFKAPDIRKTPKILYQGFNMNLFFCILQFAMGTFGDDVGGTFSNNGSLFLYCLLCSYLFIGDYLQNRLSKKGFVWRVAGMLFVAVAAEIKMMYFLLPLTLYAGYVLLKKFSINHIIILIIAFIGLIPTMSFVMSFFYNEDYINKVFDVDAIKEETTHSYGFHEGGFNRSTSIALTDQVIIRDYPQKLIGYGIGSANGSSYFKTWIFDKYKRTTFHYFAPSYIMTELGWIGFLLICIGYGILSYRFYLFYSEYHNTRIKYWSSIGLLSSVSTFVFGWYNNIPYFDYYMFYFLWAICFLAINIENKRTARNEQRFLKKLIV
ncbi:hypothetical protein OXB14_015885 [Bacteroides hominis]|uniref:hypothetical protein n=1 Tax=Bacteroides hominis TaxID=2763023 RepID=UPI0022E3844A|nr:hypothetical protein [Bacteroides fragilis]MDA1494445.1 hypothetical protein [Bacteroides fragilis]